MGLPRAREARAVLLEATPVRNTSAPTDVQEAAAWDLQAQWGAFLATPIGGQYFLAAKHVAQSSQVVFDSVAYDLDTSFHGVGYVTDPNSDLLVGKITGTFSRHADLYNAATDGSEQSKLALIFGRGTQRGADVTVPGPGLRGWAWGAGDGVQSWGKNIVSGFDNYNTSSPNSLLYCNFDRSGTPNYTPNEGALSVGDSSGGVFIYAGGEWKLAGINYAVEGPFSYTGTGPQSSGFSASVFDMRGLYVWNGSGWTLIQGTRVDAPGASYFSRVADRLDWITSQTPGPGSYWAPTPSGGGTGTWTSTSSYWAIVPGSQGYGSQANTGPLIFAGTAGAVTVGQAGASTVTVAKGMTFQVDGYSFVAGTTDSKIILGGVSTDNVITVTNSGHTATIGVPLDGVAGLIKDGAGKLVLNGANTYSGVTTVAHGSLELGSAAVANVIGVYNSSNQTLSGGNGADIQHGKLVINYAGASPEPGIANALKTASASAFAPGSGPIYSTTANGAGRALGWSDNGTSSVTVMYTLQGDVTLDGTVNFDDLSKVLTNYNQAGTWASGDVTYDGMVNFDDLSRVLTDYNTSLGANETGSGTPTFGATGGYTVVPEPSSVVLLITGAMGLLAYGQRKRSRLSNPR